MQNPKQLKQTSLIIWGTFCSTVGIIVFLSHGKAQEMMTGAEVPSYWVAAAILLGLVSVGIRWFYHAAGLQKWHVRNIANWALNEAIGFVGYQIVLQGAGFNAALPYFAASLVLLVMMFPKFPEELG